MERQQQAMSVRDLERNMLRAENAQLRAAIVEVIDSGRVHLSPARVVAGGRGPGLVVTVIMGLVGLVILGLLFAGWLVVAGIMAAVVAVLFVIEAVLRF